MESSPLSFRLLYGGDAARGRFRLTIWANGWRQGDEATVKGAVLLRPTSLREETLASALSGDAHELFDRLAAAGLPDRIPATTPDVLDYTRTGSATLFLEVGERACQIVSRRSYRFTGPDGPSLDAVLDALLTLAGVPLPPGDEIVY